MEGRAGVQRQITVCWVPLLCAAPSWHSQRVSCCRDKQTCCRDRNNNSRRGNGHESHPSLGHPAHSPAGLMFLPLGGEGTESGGRARVTCCPSGCDTCGCAEARPLFCICTLRFSPGNLFLQLGVVSVLTGLCAGGGGGSLSPPRAIVLQERPSSPSFILLLGGWFC